jgi:hypothetical protein
MELKFLYAGPGTLWTDSKELGIRANLPIDQTLETPKAVAPKR